VVYVHAVETSLRRVKKEVRIMKLKKKDLKTISKALIGLSVVAVLAAGWGFLVSDIWLASTQWLLVAAVLAAFGLYAKMEG